MTDVRDILEIHSGKHGANSKNNKKSRRLIEQAKRPQGVNREVWGLINKDDSSGQPPLIPSEEPKLYKHPKAKLRRGVRKWHWVGFKNPARADNASFSHWRCVNDDPNKEYPFAKYNKKVNVAKYTDAEYEQFLRDEAWTREETDHLFELCQTYDLRFFVIHDRWDPSRFATTGGGKSRTIDELKDRYYKVTGIVQKLHTSCDDSQIFVFDMEHEHKRREQLEKLFNRTKEQVDEELYLIEELKKIEARKKEREKKQQEVDKLLTAVGDMETSSAGSSAVSGSLQNGSLLLKNRSNLAQKGIGSAGGSNLGGSSRSNRNKQRNRDGRMSLNTSWAPQNGTSNGLDASGAASNSLNNSGDASSLNQSASPTGLNGDKNKKPSLFKTNVESMGIKFPDVKQPGVSLRSYKMKLPQSVGLRKLKAIESVLDELQIEPRPIATEAVCEQFNELRSDIVLLYELHQALSSSEYELQTLRHRYESVLVSKNIDLAQFEMPSQSSTLVNTLVQANNTPQKRISEILDPVAAATGLSQTGPLERRRKAALNQTNFIKRLRGRNAT